MPTAMAEKRSRCDCNKGGNSGDNDRGNSDGDDGGDGGAYDGVIVTGRWWC